MSEQLEREIKSRSGIRREFTKICNRIEALIESKAQLDDIDIQVKLLDMRFEMLCSRDTAIYELMVEGTYTDEDMDTEIEKVDEYTAGYYKTKKTVSKLFEIEVRDGSNLDSNSCSEKSYAPGSKSCSYKLPKLSFKEYNGDLKDWLSFWSQFKKIDSDSRMDPDEKVQYLVMATAPNSPAREVVQSYPETGEMYPEIIKALKDRFGRKDMLTEYYIRELLNIILQNTLCVNKMSLSVLYDKLQCHLRNLNTLGVTSENCAPILLPLVASCLPEDVLKLWERSLAIARTSDKEEEDTSQGRLDKIMNFLRREVEGDQKVALAMKGFKMSDKVGKKRESKVVSPRENLQLPTPTAASLLVSAKEKGCIFCGGNHKSQECIKAQSMHLQDRRRVIEKCRACFCCLRVGHTAKMCRSRPKCIICSKPHHPIVCNNSTPSKDKPTPDDAKEAAATETLTSLVTPCPVLLQTLRVTLKGKTNSRVVRAIIDTASHRTYILNSSANEVGYEATGKESLQHSLFGGVSTVISDHDIYDVHLSSLDDQYLCKFQAFGQEKICNNISSVIRGPWLDELDSLNIKLTDVESNGPIELLIGADICGKLLTGGQRMLKCGLVAVQFKLGWTLMGKLPDKCQHIDKGSAMIVTSMLTKDVKITDLWTLDTLGIRDPAEHLNKAELEAATLRHFLKTVKTTDDGRFEVHLPWIENHPPLSSNYDIALKRMHSTVKKLKLEGYYEAYQAVFDEWIEEGVIEEIPTEYEDHLPCHYLPHRHVIKSGSTTPVRPVFDASASGNGKPSLNQCLEKGPNCIEKIPSVLARFRLKRIGVVGDIRRAFLQISVTPNDRNYLRFLWLDKMNKLKTYRHCRVVFGLTSSPFELGACIDLHLEQVLSECKDGKRNIPVNLIERLKSSFYVDNCVTSLEDEEETDEFIRVAKTVMKERKFDLRGWESNTMEIVPPTNVLGLLWDRCDDTLGVNVSNLLTMNVETITKRTILSIAHRLFDPIGLTCCVTLLPKLLLQQAWEKGLGWDQEVDDDLKKQFLTWFKDIHFLAEVKVPRWLPGCNVRDNNWTLHIFSDASKKSYGVAAFLRVQLQEEVRVQLVCAKARVSPVGKHSKKMTIPRLELLAASMAARLFGHITRECGFDDISTMFWTDSTTILAWIDRDEPWDVFVYNRVKEIRKLTRGYRWGHVPGTMNPADLPSRGCSAKKLLESKWWEGPKWLKASEENWPRADLRYDEEEINSEKKKTVVSSLLCQDQPLNWYYRYFSSYKKIVRMIGWILRFKKNATIKKEERLHQDLSVEEYLLSEIKLFSLIQKEVFDGVMDTRLKTLLPFLDNDGLIRLMTKVSHKEDIRDFCHPIVLPGKHPVVSRLILYLHQNSCHAGLQTTMTLLRERFWILGGRRTVRKVLNSCITCKRYSAKRIEVFPSPLPEVRTRNAKVFEVCGVDLAGPLYLKIRGGMEHKAYVCLFTCAVYRAVHMELISSQSTDSFIQGFRRFTSRRGRPSVMYSDNGSNFVGFRNSSEELDWTAISQYSAAKKIEWRFIPPTSPWWGGWWERLIGVLKNLLRRVLGHSAVDYEMMQTILCDCEAIVNSRPLTYLSQDPSDLTALTPNMFLRDVEEVGVPDFDLIEADHLRERLHYRQRLRESLRERFRSEYLGQLKMVVNSHRERNVRVGDIVLIGSDNRKRLDWPLARVIEVMRGKDGRTRLARLKTSTDEILRPVQRLYPLELEARPSDEVESIGSFLRESVPEVMVGSSNEADGIPNEADDIPDEADDIPDEADDIPTSPAKTRSGRAVKAPKRLNL